MRNHVTFAYPAEFVPVSEDDGILAVSGSRWFESLLRRLPGLAINQEPLQEDWGVVIYASRNRTRFWIGLSQWNHEGAWLAHFHLKSSWLGWASASAKRELASLLSAVHAVLRSDPAVTAIAWHTEGGLDAPCPVCFPSPDEE
jgi:hypothetical protein